MNEFSILSQVFTHNADLPERVSLPPGDDMGMVRLVGRDVLVAVDQVIDGRHVNIANDALELVGGKAVARSLSDIAAMAARPVASLAAVVLPEGFSEEKAMRLFEGMRDKASRHDCPLVGGDIAVGSGPLVCSTTVLAEPGPGGAIQRDGARVGDHIYVTGVLGGAWRDGNDHHLTFCPRIDFALELAALVEIHAMIDISDGLGRDLDHIASMSKVAAVLERETIPLRAGFEWKHAVGDGEDYELCFTLAPDQNVPDSLGGVRITRIGQIEPTPEVGLPRTSLWDDGELIDIAGEGWEHHS